MSKRELIDRIRILNPTAPSSFLAGFKEADLSLYLEHLEETVPARRPQPHAAIPGTAGDDRGDPRQLALAF